MTIRDILIRKETILTADPGDQLSSVLSQTKATHDAVFVFDKQGKYKGVVTPYYAMIKKTYPLGTKVATAIMHPPKLEITDSISRAATMMIESKMHLLPVFQQGKFYGVTSARALLYKLQKSQYFKITIAEYLANRKPLISINLEDTITHALDIFKTNKITKLIVIAKDFTVRGILVEYDIMNVLHAPRERQSWGMMGGGDMKHTITNKKVKDFYKSSVIIAQPEHMLSGAIDQMLKQKIGTVIIADRSRHPLGIISTRDLLDRIVPKKQGFHIEIFPIHLSFPNQRVLEEFALNTQKALGHVPFVDKIVLKATESKKGGAYDLSWHIFQKGRLEKVITKHGKNLGGMLDKFRKTLQSFVAKKK